MIRLLFDDERHPEPFTIYLARHNHERLGQIINIDNDSVTFVGNLNSACELSFTVHKYMDGVEEPLWDEIYDLRYIYVPEIGDKGMFFEMKVDPTENQNDDIKSITCTSAAEAELSQIMLYGYEINTSDDPNVINKKISAALWRQNEEGEPTSILGRVLTSAPNWSVAHVDASLIQEIYPPFSVDDKSIYDFLTNDLAQEFNCLFQFDSVDRTISVYDLYTVCENDDCSFFKTNGRRYRGAFSDKCPICGSPKIKYFGKDTTCFADIDNLTDEVQLTTATDQIKNVFKLEAGDDLMTATVKNINPNGSDRIYYFSQQTLHDMSDELRNKISDYNTLYNSQVSDYESITKKIYDTMTQINYLTDVKVPDTTTKVGDMTASTQAGRLNATTMSPVAVRHLDANTSQSLVESAVKNYAKVYVKYAYYDIKITTNSYSFNSSSGRGTWNGIITLTNREDIDDIEVKYGDIKTSTGTNPDIASVELNLEVTPDYEEYLHQKVAYEIGKVQNTLDNKGRIKQPGNIYDVLSYKLTVDTEGNATDPSKSEFQNFLKEYCLDRLKSFQEAVENGMGALISLGTGSPTDKLGNKVDGYEEVYLPLHAMYNLITSEVETRQSEIDAQNALLSTYQDQRNAIQEKLDFKKYLGDDLYNEFLTYRRETTYKDTNCTTDNTINANGTYDNGKIIQRAKEFYNKAKKDAVKSGEYQFSISTNLYNLLLIEGFEPLLNDFDLGNFIRVRVDEEVYRLRLIKYEINFGDLSQLNTEFSNFTKTADGMNDIQSVLSQAQQMGKSYDYVQTQATNGERAAYTIEEYRLSGLDSAYYKIMNNNNEEVTMDSRGIIARAYDDVTDNYDPKQLRITHNILAFTHDNWKTVDCALGNFTYWDQDINKHENEYGLNASFVIGGFIAGTTMMAGDLYSMGHVNPTHVNNGGTGINGYQIVKGYENRISDKAISYYVSDDGMSMLTGQAVSKDFPHMTHINLTNGDFNFGHGTFWFDAASRTLTLNGGIFNAGTINATTINGVHIFGSDIHGTYIYGSHFYGGDLHIGAIGGISKDSKYHFNVQSDGTLTIGDAPTGTDPWPDKYPFEVDPDGSMYATNGHFRGDLFGSRFYGGELHIGPTTSSFDENSTYYFNVDNTGNLTIGLEDTSLEGGYPFKVTNDGKLYANDGYFRGSIEASEIHIGKQTDAKLDSSGYNFNVTKEGEMESINGHIAAFQYDNKQLIYQRWNGSSYTSDDISMGLGLITSQNPLMNDTASGSLISANSMTPFDNMDYTSNDGNPGLLIYKQGVGEAILSPGRFRIVNPDGGVNAMIDIHAATARFDRFDDSNKPTTWFHIDCSKASNNGTITDDESYGTTDDSKKLEQFRNQNCVLVTNGNIACGANLSLVATRRWVRGKATTGSNTGWQDVTINDNSFVLATRRFLRHLATSGTKSGDEYLRMDESSLLGNDYTLATVDFVNDKLQNSDTMKGIKDDIKDIKNRLDRLESK